MVNKEKILNSFFKNKYFFVIPFFLTIILFLYFQFFNISEKELSGDIKNSQIRVSSFSYQHKDILSIEEISGLTFPFGFTSEDFKKTIFDLPFYNLNYEKFNLINNFRSIKFHKKDPNRLQRLWKPLRVTLYPKRDLQQDNFTIVKKYQSIEVMYVIYTENIDNNYKIHTGIFIFDQNNTDIKNKKLIKKIKDDLDDIFGKINLNILNLLVDESNKMLDLNKEMQNAITNYDEIKNHALFMKKIITPKYNFDTLKNSKLIKDYFFEKSINKNLSHIKTSYLIPRENSNYYKIMIIGFILSLLVFLLRVILDFNKKLNDG